MGQDTSKQRNGASSSHGSASKGAKNGAWRSKSQRRVVYKRRSLVRMAEQSPYVERPSLTERRSLDGMGQLELDDNPDEVFVYEQPQENAFVGPASGEFGGILHESQKKKLARHRKSIDKPRPRVIAPSKLRKVSQSASQVREQLQQSLNKDHDPSTHAGKDELLERALGVEHSATPEERRASMVARMNTDLSPWLDDSPNELTRGRDSSADSKPDADGRPPRAPVRRYHSKHYKYIDDTALSENVSSLSWDEAQRKAQSTLNEDVKRPKVELDPWFQASTDVQADLDALPVRVQTPTRLFGTEKQLRSSSFKSKHPGVRLGEGVPVEDASSATAPEAGVVRVTASDSKDGLQHAEPNGAETKQSNVVSTATIKRQRPEQRYGKGTPHAKHGLKALLRKPVEVSDDSEYSEDIDDDDDGIERMKCPYLHKRSQSVSHRPSALLTKRPLRATHRRSNSLDTLFVTHTISYPNTTQLIESMAVRFHRLITNPLDDVKGASIVEFEPTDAHIMYYEDATAFVNPPTVDTIIAFLRPTFEESQLSPECYLMLAIYTERLLKHADINLTPSNWRHVVFTTTLVASKVWDDLSMINIDFTKVDKMYSITDINRMEDRFLQCVDYDLCVFGDEYTQFYFELRELHEEYYGARQTLPSVDLLPVSWLHAWKMDVADPFDESSGIHLVDAKPPAV